MLKHFLKQKNNNNKPLSVHTLTPIEMLRGFVLWAEAITTGEECKMKTEEADWYH